MVLVLVWGAVTIGIAFDYAQLGAIPYGLMSSLVYSIIGIQWGLEIQFLDVQTGGSDEK